MWGVHLSTVSPSSSSTRRSTPCVEGCCGPMLMVIVSPLVAGSMPRSTVMPVGRLCPRWSPVSAGLGLKATAMVFRACLFADVVGELDLLAAEGIVLAQGVADPVVGHHD